MSKNQALRKIGFKTVLHNYLINTIILITVLKFELFELFEKYHYSNNIRIIRLIQLS